MAHTLDTFNRFAAAATDPINQSYTCGAGTTVLVIGLAVGSTTARAGGTPTYNGVAMTQGDTRRVAANEVAVEVWYLINPPTGVAYTISIPNTGTLNIANTAASFKAATGYGTQYDVGNGNTNAASASASQAITTTVNGDAVFQIAAHQANSLGTISYSHTQFGATDRGTWVEGSQYALQATLGTITMTITNLGGATTNVVTSVVSFKEYALSNIKTIQGVTRANVKTVMGLPIASMKTWGGLV